MTTQSMLKVLFWAGLALIFFGVADIIVEQVTGVKQSDLWLYKGPVGLIVAAVGVLATAFAVKPEAVLAKIPGVKPADQTPAVPPMPPEPPKNA